MFVNKWLLLVLYIYSTGSFGSLIGDEIRIAHRLGDTDFETEIVTVTSDNSDAVFLITNSPRYFVDVNAFSVLIDFIPVNTGGLTSPIAQWNGFYFNGAVIRDIDTPLFNLNLVTNFIGWDDSRFFYVDDDLMFDWRGLNSTPDVFIELTFDSTPSSIDVSAPSSMPILLIFCICLTFLSHRANSSKSRISKIKNLYT